MKRNYRLLILVIALLSIMTAIFAGCGVISSGSHSPSSAKETSGITVKVLDVGQGDAILIQTGEQNILVDAGDTDEIEKLKAALKKDNIKVIDKLIITHPHRDHLGGALTVFQDCEVKAVYDNGQTATPKFYREYLRTIKAKNIPYKALRDGDILDFGSGVRFEVLSPTEDMVKEGGRTKDGKINLNLNSLVGRLVYNQFAMMLTGDAEKPTEQGILQRHQNDTLHCQVLKAGHHGSKTSSSAKFLEAISPEAALISCGAGNPYHHPHPSIREKYKKYRIDFYRTDINGTITVVSDGIGYQVSIERGEKNSSKGN